MDRRDLGIRNCRFRFRCTRTWESMAATQSKTVRFCSDCNEAVHLCCTPEDLVAAIASNRCVAFDPEAIAGNPSEEAPMVVGQMETYFD